MRGSLARLALLALLAFTAAAPALLLHPSAAVADDDDDDDEGWRPHRHRHWREGPPPFYYVRPRDRVVIYDEPPAYVIERPRPVYVAPAPGITVNIPLHFD